MSARKSSTKGVSQQRKRLPLYLDEELERMIEELRKKYGGVSKNDIVRIALTKLYEKEVLGKGG